MSTQLKRRLGYALLWLPFVVIVVRIAGWRMTAEFALAGVVGAGWVSLAWWLIAGGNSER